MHFIDYSVLIETIVSTDCTTVGRAKFCYYVTQIYKFGAAEQICKTKGGNLASIDSAAEQTAVHNLIKSVSGSVEYTWIGYIDNQATGVNWNWIDGLGGYTNWEFDDPYEPESGRYLCTILRKSNGKWSNISCSLNAPFVCRSVSYSIVLI